MSGGVARILWAGEAFSDYVMTWTETAISVRTRESNKSQQYIRVSLQHLCVICDCNYIVI